MAGSNVEEEGAVGFAIPSTSSSGQQFVYASSQPLEPRSVTTFSSAPVSSSSGQFMAILSPPLNQFMTSPAVAVEQQQPPVHPPAVAIEQQQPPILPQPEVQPQQEVPQPEGQHQPDAQHVQHQPNAQLQPIVVLQPNVQIQPIMQNQPEAQHLPNAEHHDQQRPGNRSPPLDPVNFPNRFLVVHNEHPGRRFTDGELDRTLDLIHSWYAAVDDPLISFRTIRAQRLSNTILMEPEFARAFMWFNTVLHRMQEGLDYNFRIVNDDQQDRLVRRFIRLRNVRLDEDTFLGRVARRNRNLDVSRWSVILNSARQYPENGEMRVTIMLPQSQADLIANTMEGQFRYDVPPYVRVTVPGAGTRRQRGNGAGGPVFGFRDSYF